MTKFYVCLTLALFATHLSASNATENGGQPHDNFWCFGEWAEGCSLEGIRSAELGELSVYTLYSFGKSIGICDNYGSVGLAYTPCLCECGYGPTLDLAYHYFHDGRSGASAGIGFQSVSVSDSFAGGLVVFYDYREGQFGDFQQVGASLSLIGDCFEFRANGYFPVGDSVKKGPKTIFDDYDNTGVEIPYEVIAFQKEFALSGFDAEGGLRCCWNGFTAYGGVGTYYFEKEPILDVWGVKGRLRVEYGRLLAIEGQVTWDDCTKTEGRGQLELNLPFSFFCDLCEMLSCPCKSQRRIHRDAPIHLKRRCRYEANF